VQSEPDLRVSHAALSTAAAYEGLLEDELRAGAAPLRLLELAEQRWRLLDFVRAGAPPADAIAELQRRLHPDAAVLCLVPLDDRVIGWVLRKGSVSFRHIDVGRSELDRAVEELQQSLRRSEPGARGLARALGQRVVDPFAAAMGSARRVFVIAAGALASVPFGWLLDAQGQPLGRRWELNMAPSLGYLASAAPRRGDREAPFLAVAFAGEGSDLPPLPSAEAEAGRMAQRFGGQPLLGRRATREEILRLLPDARAFHFAGHAVGHADRPGWSSLVLAGPGSRPAYLTANEVARIDLRSLDLAVLAACQAAATKAAYTEGGVTLARAFLAAGARTVVGPLWDVSDREMESLSHALYTEAGGLSRAALMPALAFEDVGPGIKAMVVFSAEGALAPPEARKE
jgi:CHAT domain-containing protein